MKHPYKVIENHWGDIFIIKAGIRQEGLGCFPTKLVAELKCKELNGEIKSEMMRAQEKCDELNGVEDEKD